MAPGFIAKGVGNDAGHASSSEIIREALRDTEVIDIRVVHGSRDAAALFATEE